MLKIQAEARGSTGAVSFVESVGKLVESVKEVSRVNKSQLSELSIYIANDLMQRASNMQNNHIFSYHRPGGDMQFIDGIAKAILASATTSTKPALYILSCGEKVSGGPVIVVSTGNFERTRDVLDTILDGMSGSIKGGGKAPKWQGKASNWRNWKETLARVDAVKFDEL